jgi:ribonuclease P protein component
MVLFSFSKNERLLNRSDFVNLNQFGKRYYTTHFTFILRGNDLGITRLGIASSKKIGNAVIRNKVKRLVREYYRTHKTYFPQGFDIVIAAKQGAGDLDFKKVKEEISAFFLDKTFH